MYRLKSVENAREPTRDCSAKLSSATKRKAQAPGLVMIGASTGGPQALIALIEGFAAMISHVPVCVTLHMPPDLMPIIAAHVARVCRVDTCVVTHRRPLVAGRVYFAPGDRHLDFQRCGLGIDVAPSEGSAHDFCMPAVDVMLESGARSHGSRALGIVLSGMGKDGLAGAHAIVAAGGEILVQDKLSSAVWGMPGAVAKAGLASAILAPAALGEEVVRRLNRNARPV